MVCNMLILSLIAQDFQTFINGECLSLLFATYFILLIVLATAGNFKSF